MPVCSDAARSASPRTGRARAATTAAKSKTVRALATAGYSSTPLAKKLGIAAGSVVLLLGAPKEFPLLLEPLPAGVRFARRTGSAVDLAHVFATSASALRSRLARLRAELRSDAAVWVSWPKKSARVATDIVEETIRGIALPLGFVDIKVCAVSEVWSGLKLVVRRELR